MLDVVLADMKYKLRGLEALIAEYEAYEPNHPNYIYLGGWLHAAKDARYDLKKWIADLESLVAKGGKGCC